jgi:hypothetical protein
VAGDAVMSLDTQQKEWLGNFHRVGTTCTTETIETFDHDFGSASHGQLMPHGVYDIVHQHAHLHLNTSHDTSALWCDSVAWWWEQAGRMAYPQGKRLLIRGDGGGSKSATPYLVKEDVPGLANRLGREMRVAHSPPYCSKHHPIEHPVFPPITRAGQGAIFHTVDSARHFIEQTTTTTGLGVTVRMLDKVSQTGRKYAADCKHNMKILFDDHLPKWHSRAVPEFT